MKDLLFFFGERLERPVFVMNHTNGCREAEFNCALRDGQSVFGVLDPAANYRIDVDVKIGMLSEVAQLLIKHAQALSRNFIRINIVDADLQRIEAGFI